MVIPWRGDHITSDYTAQVAEEPRESDFRGCFQITIIDEK